ncbi:MAG TPA: hypothetical protein VHO72_05575 [Bacteroidales bacterium]|nr:hypothetical protein [Bacteroidales bacterium]
MKTCSKIFEGLAMGGNVIGKGIIAGFAGTVAITLSQMIEMKITKRSMSKAPVIVGGNTLGVEPKGLADVEREKAKSGNEEPPQELQKKKDAYEERFSQFMHFGYGTGWGICRGALDLMGIRGTKASLIHFGGIWAAEQIMLPANKVSEPITKWSAKEIAVDALHHAVYAFAAGLVYDAMRKTNK